MLPLAAPAEPATNSVCAVLFAGLGAAAEGAFPPLMSALPVTADDTPWARTRGALVLDRDGDGTLVGLGLWVVRGAHP